MRRYDTGYADLITEFKKGANGLLIVLLTSWWNKNLF